MNKNIIKGVVALFAAGTLASCSSDYLDVAPQTSITAAIAQESEIGAESAVRGIYRSMYSQWSSWSGGAQRGFNGESWINSFYGEVAGSDAYYLLWATGIYLDYIVNGSGMTNDQYWFCQPGWLYSYTLINQCNQVLAGIDKCDTSDKVKAELSAQAKALRAHAYTLLLQIYAPRWEDSQNGETICLVKRTEDLNYGASPLVSMNEIFDLIYKDFTEAIASFEESGYKRDDGMRIDANVAKGLFARAAVLKHDYKLAQQLAHEARQGYPIMSGAEYNDGFARANGEWMWYLVTEPTDIYYCAPMAFYGCNGAYIEAWTDFGAGAINYDLYRKMDENDSRRVLYWTPDKINEEDAGIAYSKFPEASWFNKKYINTETMDMANKNLNIKKWIDKYAISPKLAGSKHPDWPGAYAFNTTKPTGNQICVPFGAQFKFWAYSSYGTSDVLFMRAAEMLTLEAECAYRNGDDATAKACLEELNSKRVPGYTCKTSGEALLEEIKISRRLELWGEGFNWFDLKRWNDPIVRNKWIEGDPTSNNIPEAGAVTILPSDHNNWRFAMPMAEWLYNDAVDNPNVVTSDGDKDKGQQQKRQSLK